MLSIYPTQRSESDGSGASSSSTSAELEESQMSSMQDELAKIRRRQTLSKFDSPSKAEPLVPQLSVFSFPSRQNSLRILARPANDMDPSPEHELSADDEVGKLPYLSQYAAERRSRILKRLVDGQEEETYEPEINPTSQTLSLCNTQQSMTYSFTGRSKPSLSRRNQNYVFRKNRNGSLTRYESRIFVDQADEGLNTDIADYTMRIQQDVLHNRATSDLLVSKFGGIFDANSYK